MQENTISQSEVSQIVEPATDAYVSRDELDYSRPLVMGILNVTPDSFSDGGKFSPPESALAQALKMIADGADIIDIGGESTRPGAEAVSTDEELTRVIPVIKLIRAESKITISIDTTKAIVAEQALACGADIVNDISAGLFDEKMIPLVAKSQAGYIVMHMLKTPQTMQKKPQYTDVVEEVSQFLYERRELCLAEGIKRELLMLDPGIGFGKTTEHNIELLTNLAALTELGSPVLVGASRKAFIGTLSTKAPRAENRLGGSLAAALFAVEHGASVVRVHDVFETAQALEIMVGLHTATPFGKEATY